MTTSCASSCDVTTSTFLSPSFSLSWPRSLAKHQYAKVYETQEDMCRKRNEIRVATLQLAAIKAQVRWHLVFCSSLPTLTVTVAVAVPVCSALFSTVSTIVCRYFCCQRVLSVWVVVLSLRGQQVWCECLSDVTSSIMFVDINKRHFEAK